MLVITWSSCTLGCAILRVGPTSGSQTLTQHQVTLLVVVLTGMFSRVGLIAPACSHLSIVVTPAGIHSSVLAIASTWLCYSWKLLEIPGLRQQSFRLNQQSYQTGACGCMWESPRIELGASHWHAAVWVTEPSSSLPPIHNLEITSQWTASLSRDWIIFSKEKNFIWDHANYPHIIHCHN